MTGTPRLRVIQWGSGGVGVESLRFILSSDQLELVGLKCYTDAKEGVDAGVIAGVPSTGVVATQDARTLLAVQADCVIFMPLDVFMDPSVGDAAPWMADLLAVLSSGKNVVSPIQSPMHWRQLAEGEALRSRLAAACEKGGSTLFFTGLDPGFISDQLVITLSSAVREITQIRTWEVIDYSTYGSPPTLESMGFGADPAAQESSSDESLVPSWGCAMWLVADALGVELDEIRLSSEQFVSPQEFTTAGGTTIGQGTVGALLWSLTGIVAGEPLIVCNHVGRMSDAMAPHWPRIGDEGGYRVEIDGSTPLRVEVPLGLGGGRGTCLEDAVAMTAARCVNFVGAIVDAAPGYLLLNDMKNVGGRPVARGRAQAAG